MRARRVARHRGAPAGACALALVLLVGSDARAWLVGEHTRLTREALAVLPQGYRRALSQAWTAAQQGPPWWRRHFSAELVIDQLVERPGGGPWRISFASVPALAADHSCSVGDLTRILTHDAWVAGVLDAGSRAQAELEAAGGDAGRRYDIRRLLDIELQFEDRDYLGRAEETSAHFVPPRRSDDLADYLRDALATGTTTNAVGLYASFHAAALEHADRAIGCSAGAGADEVPRVPESCPPPQALLWQALVMEAFALHFLQDAFASGHIAGTWGGMAERKGTHDYYCRHGLDVWTWDGASYAAYGDAFMTDEDVRRASAAAVPGLRQLALVLAPLAPTATRSPRDEDERRAIVQTVRRVRPSGEDDVCTAATVPAGLEELAEASWLREVFGHWPRPPRRIPALPRVRTEIGGFVSGSVFLGGNAIASLDGSGTEGEVHAQLGFGAGFSGDAALPDAGYGRYYAEGLVASLHSVAQAESRLGFGFHVDLPFAALPGDFPLATLASLGFGWGWPAQQLARGGWIPIFRPYAPSEGLRLQLVAGRQMTMLWFLPQGHGDAHRALRYQLRIPAFELAFGDRFHQSLGQEWVLSSGFQLDHFAGGAKAIGGYGALGLRMRTFP